MLAFAMREGEPLVPATVLARCWQWSGEMLGDVVVSIDTARRQAAERRRPLEDEVRMLLAHGLLHLVGYDHQTDQENKLMQRKTREALPSRRRRGARAGGALIRQEAPEALLFTT